MQEIPPPLEMDLALPRKYKHVLSDVIAVSNYYPP